MPRPAQISPFRTHLAPRDGISSRGARCLLAARLLLATCLCAAALAGCGGPTSQAERGPDSDAASRAAEDSGRLERETWDIVRIEGTQVGYAHTRLLRQTRDGREVFRVEARQHLRVERFGEPTEVDVAFTSVETPDGKLIELQTEMSLGPTPTRTAGRVDGGRLHLETTTAGKTVRNTIPWSDDYGGPAAMELSLLREPMKPGQERTVRSLEPGLNVVATRRLRATKPEEVELPEGRRKLLRIDLATLLPDGQQFRGTLWTDEDGDVLRSWTDAFDMVSVRATKELALAQGEELLDLGTGIAVKLDRPIARPHETVKARYRVELEGSDPAEVFPSGASQRVESTGKNTAVVTVYALRPGRPGGNPDAVPDEPTDDDRRPNSVVQSDAPKVVELARDAVGDAEDPWQKAVGLERFVGDYIRRVDFTQALATAAEVADNPTGDCTEHAVLLAAMARAAGLPARAAMGLIYVAGEQSFLYHMWTEVYIGGRWIPLDATLARGGTSAAYIKVGHSNLEGASALSSLLPVARVMRKLKVEVEEVEY